MDRGYLDFSWLYRIHKAEAYFITRAKSNFNFERMYSAKVDKTTGIKCDQTIKLCGFYVSQYYPEKRCQEKDSEKKDRKKKGKKSKIFPIISFEVILCQ